MKIYVKTFGCKVNLYDSEKNKLEFSNLGHEIICDYYNADVVIVNSCTVTSESDRKMRQFIHKIRKTSPSTQIVLAGCFPRTHPNDISKCDVDYVFDIYKDKISDLIVKIQGDKKILEIHSAKQDRFQMFSGNRTRAFLKIEDGCNNFCSYCIIPYARGRVRSKSLEDITRETDYLAKCGFKEIVAVGINLSVYGSDINSNLCEAIETIAENPGIKRIRLGSIEPNFLTPENIIRLSNIKKFCPHFHISLQSGSNKILKLMNRKYTREKYTEICDNVKKYCKNSTITTDIIVGFPGENEDDFQDSLDLIKRVEFLKAHVFPYSIRPGTLAATYKNQITNKIKSERAETMLKVAESISEKVKSTQIGKNFEILYESTDNFGNYVGYTENYIRVKTHCQQDIRGKILSTTIVGTDKNICIGKLIPI